MPTIALNWCCGLVRSLRGVSACGRRVWCTDLRGSHTRVDGDFAARKSCIALGATDDDLARGADVQVREIATESEC